MKTFEPVAEVPDGDPPRLSASIYQDPPNSTRPGASGNPSRNGNNTVGGQPTVEWLRPQLPNEIIWP